MATKKSITDELRAAYAADLADFLRQKYDTDICVTAAGTIMIPAVDSEGEDRWVKFSVIIPKDACEENGNDGYSLAQEYNLKLEAAAERKRKQAEKPPRPKPKNKENSSTSQNCQIFKSLLKS